MSDVISDLVFLIDLPLNFIFIEIDKSSGELILDRKRIARLYLKSWFIFDAVGSIPVNLITLLNQHTTLNSKYSFQLIKTIKILSIYRMLSIIRMVKVVNNKLF